MPFRNLKEVEAEVALCLIQDQDTIETVQNNMEGFTKHEVEEAKAACEAQGMLGHPTNCKFLGMVHPNMISNCSITKNAIKNASLIFEPWPCRSKGKIIEETPQTCAYWLHADPEDDPRSESDSDASCWLHVCERGIIPS